MKYVFRKHTLIHHRLSRALPSFLSQYYLFTFHFGRENILVDVKDTYIQELKYVIVEFVMDVLDVSEGKNRKRRTYRSHLHRGED